jgi:hypothetical protein
MPKYSNRPLDPIPPHIVIPEPDQSDVHFTYFAEHPQTGLIKIGSTFCPRLMTRMRELEREYGLPMNLLAVVKGGHKVERTYHAQFAADRDHREWFRPSPEMHAVILLANVPEWTPDAVAYWHEWSVLLAAEQRAPAPLERVG